MPVDDLFTRESYTSDELLFIIESIPANVFFKDTSCRYRLASHVCKMLNGDSDTATIIGKTDLEVQVEEQLGRQYYEEDLDLIAHGGEKKYISEMHFGDSTYYYEINKRAMLDASGSIIGIVGMVSDVTELIQLQKELERMSTRDMLTGCYNRTFLELRKVRGVDEMLLPFSVIISDCNGLKHVNDTFGHSVGDEYICKSVTTIRDAVPVRSEIIRLGGDEFLVLIPNCSEESCGALLASIRAECSRRSVRGIPLSNSFGATTMTSTSQTLSEAMSRADALMYAEKQHTKMDGRG